MQELNRYYAAMHDTPRPSKDRKQWLVKTTIVRRDTNAPITTFTTSGETRDSATRLACHFAPAKIPAGRPADWTGSDDGSSP
jgi:hypothetical protein